MDLIKLKENEKSPTLLRGGEGWESRSLAVIACDLWLTGQRQLAVKECSRKF